MSGPFFLNYRPTISGRESRMSCRSSRSTRRSLSKSSPQRSRPDWSLFPGAGISDSSPEALSLGRWRPIGLSAPGTRMRGATLAALQRR